MSKTLQLATEDDFEAIFRSEHGPAPDVVKEMRERHQREKSMRSKHGDGRKARHKGDRVQFNLKVSRRLKDQVTSLCHRHRVSQTEALEQALSLWVRDMGKRHG